MSDSGFSVHRISHPKILEWVAISFSRVPSQPRDGNPCLPHWQGDFFLPLSHLGLNIVVLKAAQLCPTLYDPVDCPWNSLGQNTGVGRLSLLQGIFPTQGLSPGLLHGRRILYQLSHKGSPRTLKWVAYPFSRGSSRPRNQTGVSCIAGRFFTN